MGRNTVVLRIQVIDMDPKTLDLTLPDYLRASDLSQRIARDAGLKTHWANNTRRLYQLRARGRLMHRNETLRDLNVVNNELIYILPQISPNSHIQEQYPEYPEETKYIAGALSILLMLLCVIMFLSVCWGLSLAESTHWVTLFLPAMGIGILSTSFARHAWGGKARRIRVILLGVTLFAIALLPCFLVSYFIPESAFEPSTPVEPGEEPEKLSVQFIYFTRMFPGMITGFVGTVISWVAWWGAVEPLNKKQQEEIKEEAAKDLPKCAICGGPVAAHVLVRSSNNCRTCAPNVFHQGCYTAKLTAYYGPEGHCKICKSYLG